MPQPRTFLFLQGPISPLFPRIARALEARGHAIRKITISVGDWLSWLRRGSTAWRGTFENWPAFLDGYLAREGITDIVLFGDCRPYHVEAIALAQERGIAVHAIELGYLRPDWITLERDGVNSFSHFPREPEAIRKLAEGTPPLDTALRFPFSVIAMTWMDIRYVWTDSLLSPLLYPHYRWHGPYHPLHEHWGWVRRLMNWPAAWWRRRYELREFRSLKKPFFIFPLQLATDYQIRVHSPFANLEEAIEAVVASFARNTTGDVLLIKPHPLDNGLVDWRAVVAQCARAHGCADRVHYIEGVDLGELIRRAKGLVTVNSTLGTAAIGAACPTIALGNAIYDVPGLTHQGPLDRFWSEAAPPDKALGDAFMRALAATNQVRGTLYSRAGMAAAAAAIAAKLDANVERLPRRAPQDRGERPVRKRI